MGRSLPFSPPVYYVAARSSLAVFRSARAPRVLHEYDCGGSPRVVSVGEPHQDSACGVSLRLAQKWRLDTYPNTHALAEAYSLAFGKRDGSSATAPTGSARRPLGESIGYGIAFDLWRIKLSLKGAAPRLHRDGNLLVLIKGDSPGPSCRDGHQFARADCGRARLAARG